MARKYFYADESGNFDFRCHEQYPGASRYFAVGTVMIVGDAAVEALEADMLKLKRQLAWNNVVHDDALHASEDSQAVRNALGGGDPELLGSISGTAIKNRQIDQRSLAQTVT